MKCYNRSSGTTSNDILKRVLVYTQLKKPDLDNISNSSYGINENQQRTQFLMATQGTYMIMLLLYYITLE